MSNQTEPSSPQNEPQFPKIFIVQGDRMTVDEDMHNALNELARRFYVLHGNTVPNDHDFAASPHPGENLMYSMALEAAYFQQSSGELDG